MRVIGINGHKGAGKGEVGNLLESLMGAKQIGFADKLKIIAAKSLGFDRTDQELIDLMNSIKNGAMFSVFYDEPGSPSTDLEDNAVFHNLYGRQYLQWFGQHMREQFGDTIWIDQVLPSVTGPYTYQTALRQMYSASYLAITDLRYPNEAERVLALDGEVWRITRSGCSPDGHPSEEPLPDSLVTRTISNNGTLEDLEYKVLEALGVPF